MALFNLALAADSLDDLLDHERALILAGKIDALVRMAPEKERLLARLPDAVDERSTLERLRGKLEHNQELLVQAARGLKAAGARVRALRTGRTSLRTYGSDGASTDLGRSIPGFNKRA